VTILMIDVEVAAGCARSGAAHIRTGDRALEGGRGEPGAPDASVRHAELLPALGREALRRDPSPPTGLAANGELTRVM
jgi:hypothetical protein